MKPATLLFLAALLFNCGLRSMAQMPTTAAGYTFSAATAPYTYLSGGTAMPATWTGDDNYASVPIGFTFSFCGIAYTNVSVANNGFMSFATLTSGAYYGPASVSSVAPVLMPFWANLDGTTQGSGVYAVSGIAPNRVFTFEWKKWGVSPNATATNQNTISFQVKLYENGFIEYLYKQESNAPVVSAGIGIARTATDYILLTTPSASPLTTSSAPTTVTTGRPATNQVYRFSFCVTPAVAAQPQPLTKCSGDSAVFLVNAGSVASYQWQVNYGSGFSNLFGSPTCIGVNTNQLTIKNLPNSSSNHVYRAVLTGNCATTVNTSSATLTLSDGVKDDSLSPSDTFCEGNAAHLDVLAGAAGIVYNWQMEDKNGMFFDLPVSPVYSGNKSNILHISGATDTMNNRNFRVILAATSSCPVKTSLTSNNIHIAVKLKPVVSPATAIVNDGSSAQFVATMSGSTAGYSYQWQEDTRNGGGFHDVHDNASYNGSNTDTLLLNNVTLQQNRAIYRCIVNGTCAVGYIISKTAELTVNTLSVGSVAEAQGISVYPNPVVGAELNLATEQPMSGNTAIRIMDQLGRIAQTSVININGVKTATIDISNLPAGKYILQLGNATVTCSVQFVKQ